MDPETRDKIQQANAGIADETGATLYPHLRVAGHDMGRRVSEFYGTNMTSYEWVYVVEPDRSDALIGLLGAAAINTHRERRPANGVPTAVPMAAGIAVCSKMND